MNADELERSAWCLGGIRFRAACVWNLLLYRERGLRGRGSSAFIPFGHLEASFVFPLYIFYVKSHGGLRPAQLEGQDHLELMK